MQQYIDVGRKIYDKGGIKEFRRMAAFVLRSLIHNTQMQEMLAFFNGTALRRDITEAFPAILAQATRPFFFRKASFQERADLIRQHFSFLESQLSEEVLRQIYVKEGLPLWCMEYKEGTLTANLHFRDVNKKEGLTTVILKVGQEIIYQLVFWIAPNKNGEMSLWIGALQGQAGGYDIIKVLTKRFFGYRPKNMMLHVARIIARQLQITRIYAVSNFGFYDSTLPPEKQKLKTSLDSFWQETGGVLCDDPRFYELPVIEPQKTIEEVVSHKRNLYRKRFGLLDEIDLEITNVLKPHFFNEKNKNHFVKMVAATLKK